MNQERHIHKEAQMPDRNRHVSGKEKHAQDAAEKQKIHRLAAILFLSMLVMIGMFNIIKKDAEFSEQENRMLVQKPKLTRAGIVNGRFMKQYEDYVSDQFAGRDFWVGLKTRADLIAGKRESNGIFKGKDHYLLEDIVVPDETTNKKNIKAINKFQKKYKDIPVNVMLAPNAANILKEKLPAFAVTADQEKEMTGVREALGEDIQWIDASTPLKRHKKENIYYRTDHHWTSLGAYYVFEEAAKTLGIGEYKITMEPYTVSNSFNGALSGKSGYETGYKEPLQVYLPKENEVEFMVNDVAGQKKQVSLYDTSKLKGKDKYAVFLGGNKPILDIKTTNDNRKRLLLFKDSYANAFIPFLVPYYREIVVIDMRYFYGTVSDIVRNYQITEVLFLYNGNTFFGGQTLEQVLL